MLFTQIAEDGRFVVLEHLDRGYVASHTLPVETALTKEKVERLKEFESRAVEPDDECPELSDDEISEILQEAMDQKKAKD